ncbi:unnamed protein product [Brassica rapa subsp. trilocularis]
MVMYGGGAWKDGESNNHISEGGVALKKGPWTAAEDEMLASYVRENGEGNWNSLQKNTGLTRCGKSCRLRWANHLRPNLKKGSFTDDEERIIIQLHAQLGNKWARMAAQLPGRTDNEIKNYWNMRLKRLQRQGLPLYPPDIILYHQLHKHNHYHDQQHQHNQIESYTSFLTLPYSSPTAQNATYYNTNNIYSSSPSFSLNPSPSSYPTTSSSSPSFLHSYYTPNSSSTSFHTNTTYSMKQELPSNQTLQICAFNNVNNFTDNEKHNSTGFHRRSISCSLLEDVLKEAEALEDISVDRPPKRRQLTASPPKNHNNNGDFFSVSFGQYGSSENTCSLQDLKSKEEVSLQMNTMQEDVAKFFDWESNSGEILNGQSSVVTDDNLVLDVHQFESLAANYEQNNNNNCSWDDLHEIR